MRTIIGMEDAMRIGANIIREQSKVGVEWDGSPDGAVRRTDRSGVSPNMRCAMNLRLVGVRLIRQFE